MQCQKRVWRSVCGSHNAYNPLLALRATFAGTSITSESATPQSTPFDASETQPSHSRKRDGEASPFRQNGHAHEVDANYSMRNHNGLRIRRQRGVVDAFGWQSLIRRMKWCLEWEVRLDKEAIVKGEEIPRPNVDWKRLRSIFEYHPSVVLPQKPEEGEDGMPPPWTLRIDGMHSSLSGSEMLSQEMRKFVNWIELTPMEKVAREAAVKETYELTYGLFKNEKELRAIRMELQGSEKTGLALPMSDLDFQITPTKRTNRLHMMKLLHDDFNKSPNFILARYRGGPFPILNVQHKATGLDIQIIAGTTTHKQDAIVHKYLAEIPNLRELFFIVRSFFAMRGLNNVFNGGLGSYGIFILLVAALKRMSSSQRADQSLYDRDNTLWLQLKSFFDCYSHSHRSSVDFTRYGFACHPHFRFVKHPVSPSLSAHELAAERRGDKLRAGQWRICAKSEYQPYLLCLQDPADPRNDLGRKTHAIKHIIATMRHTNSTLLENFARYKQTPEEWSGKSFLEPMVGRLDLVYRDQRHRLEEYGKEIMEMKAKDPGEGPMLEETQETLDTR